MAIPKESRAIRAVPSALATKKVSFSSAIPSGSAMCTNRLRKKNDEGAGVPEQPDEGAAPVVDTQNALKAMVARVKKSG